MQCTIIYTRIIEEHNKLIPDYILKTCKGKKNLMISNAAKEKYKTLNLPGCFEKITTISRLAAESKIQHNCAVTYAEKIKNGTCCIYSFLFENKRYTMEIRKRNGKFIIWQLKGKFNDEPSETVMNYALKQLDLANGCCH